ncbi:hypothetical protein AMS68_007979 [Peltaster fructicola]|uniref:CAP-Gly domain-containing protein n=1 Tax=Peltaster fructicola TaxID=286661 RepID=A0A6H0Y5Y7_9PEZI|nr:hypothetical protein AMS68_007979 [Peltaster fructicola]
MAAADIPLIIISANSTSERRINPSWTIAQLKARLEPITGVPAGSQRLSLKVASQQPQLIEAVDEDRQTLSHWALQAYAEIQITDTRPPGVRENYTDTSNVEKYTLPITEYEARSDSVLAWKKAQKLGRFDPNAPNIVQEKTEATFQEVESRGLKTGSRCRLLPATDHRRGTIAYIGEVAEIPGSVGAWIGIILDEPTGKNDGSVGGKAYFKCQPSFGVFVRPERVEQGDFPPASIEDELDEEF